MTFLPKSLPPNDRRWAAFLFLGVLALYLPAISGAINSIDDAGILQFYGADHLSLADALRPGGGYYYRPVIALSFYLDHHLFGQDPALLHLENILIHGINAALVFLLAKRLLPAAPAPLPVLASLVFATHPVNAEAVNWIAGRTDPLAALFLLLSVLCLCRALESGKGRCTVLSVALLLLAIFTKETALLFVPGSFLLIQSWLEARPGAPLEGARRQRKALCLFYLAVCLAFAAVLIYRSSSAANSVGKLLHGGKLDLLSAVPLSLKIVGFYAKKMVVPWPLNFAIVSVGTWYLVPGVLVLALLFLLPRKNPYFPLMLCGLLFLIPAIAVGVFDVAWTVVAERYLYIPSAFFAIGGIGYLYRAAPLMRGERLLVPLMSLVIVVAGGSCWARTGTWHSNLSLYRDTVAKTPDFGMLHNALAVALIQEGRYAEADEELNQAAALEPSDLVKGLIRRSRLALQMRGQTPYSGYLHLKKYGNRVAQEDTVVLTMRRLFGNNAMKDLPPELAAGALAADLIEIDEELYRRTGDPLLLYNSGQLLMLQGDRERAADRFARSYRAAPDGAFYKPAAKKLAEKLGGRRL